MLTGLSEVWLAVVALGTLLLKTPRLGTESRSLLGRFIAVDVVKICCKDGAVAGLTRYPRQRVSDAFDGEGKVSWACVKIGTEKETLS